MNSPMNGHQATIPSRPPLERWREWCRNAPDDQLTLLCITAFDSLQADGLDERWAPFVIVVEETMRERGLRR
jgi:hypothetical protein